MNKQEKDRVVSCAMSCVQVVANSEPDLSKEDFIRAVMKKIALLRTMSPCNDCGLWSKEDEEYCPWCEDK